VLWQVPLSVALMSFFYASISVAVASLTDRRLIGAAIFLVTILVSLTVSGVMVEVTTSGFGSDGSSLWGVTNIPSIPLYLRDYIFLGNAEPGSALDGLSGGFAIVVGVYTALVAASWGTLWLRYGAREIR